MRRPAGIETEYGLNCEGFPGAPGGAAGGAGPGLPGGAAVDFAYECSRLVRAADVPGAFRGWDYQGEDPYRDLRGMRVERLARDPHDLQGPSDRSRHLSREELLANTVLLNGARFYNDHNHPEYCTEACLSLLDLVAQDKAGERVLFACEGRRNAELAQEVGPGTRVRVLKNNTDYHGRTYGMHENYLFPRSIPLETVIRATIPFFVTRQIFCGAGKVGIETSGGDVQPGFQLSQRADFFEERIGINTTAQRPLFNTRDEPHADKGKYRRLHVINGDANRSEWATAMKVGTTALVLDLIEDGWTPAPSTSIDPVAAFKLISRGHDLMATVALSGGRVVRAVDVQRQYLEAARAALRRARLGDGLGAAAVGGGPRRPSSPTPRPSPTASTGWPSGASSSSCGAPQPLREKGGGGRRLGQPRPAPAGPGLPPARPGPQPLRGPAQAGAHAPPGHGRAGDARPHQRPAQYQGRRAGPLAQPLRAGHQAVRMGFGHVRQQRARGAPAAGRDQRAAGAAGRAAGAGGARPRVAVHGHEGRKRVAMSAESHTALADAAPSTVHATVPRPP